MKKIIHIGANKAASTTLQKHFFSKSKNISYLGESCKEYNQHYNLLYSLITNDDIFFDYISTKNLFDKFLHDKKNETFIYSNEDILRSRVATQCCERLYSIIPESSILLIIRNQFDAIVSWYANHGAYLRDVPKNHWKKHVDFEDWIQYCTEFFSINPLAGFMYNKHIELYEKFFGKNNIKILLFEDFLKNKEFFFDQLSNIFGVNKNEVKILLSKKHERKRKIQNNIVLEDRWLKEIKNIYKKDNEDLSRKYNLNLYNYGYPI